MKTGTIGVATGNASVAVPKIEIHRAIRASACRPSKCAVPGSTRAGPGRSGRQQQRAIALIQDWPRRAMTGFPLPAPMRRALDLAAAAAADGEVPVGAVITLNARSLPRHAMRCAGRSIRRPCRNRRDRLAATRLGAARLDAAACGSASNPARCARGDRLARISQLRFAAEDPKAAESFTARESSASRRATTGPTCWAGLARPKRRRNCGPFCPAANLTKRAPSAWTTPSRFGVGPSSPAIAGHGDDLDLDPAVLRAAVLGVVGRNRRAFAEAAHPMRADATPRDDRLVCHGLGAVDRQDLVRLVDCPSHRCGRARRRRSGL